MMTRKQGVTLHDIIISYARYYNIVHGESAEKNYNILIFNKIIWDFKANSSEFRRGVFWQILAKNNVKHKDIVWNRRKGRYFSGQNTPV